MTGISFPTIASAITALYKKTGVKPPSAKSSITPLGKIVSSLNLNCIELPKLTSRAAADFLLRRGVDVMPSDNINQVLLAGYLYVSMNFGCIFINQSDRVTRRRFSVAHEVGHYVLHFRPLLDELKRHGELLTISITDAPSNAGLNGAAESEDSTDTGLIGKVSFSDNEVIAGFLPPDEQMEMEADLFATELLMPSAVMMERASEAALPKDDLSWRLATEMLVSRSTMCRRLDELKLF